MSVTALIGTNAQFHCAGTGNYLVWVVDGLQADHSNILARGIISDTTTDSGTVQSNLTVPATPENNGTTVRCAISVLLFTPPVISSNATLSILPGELFKSIGRSVFDTQAPVWHRFLQSLKKLKLSSL